MEVLSMRTKGSKRTVAGAALVGLALLASLAQAGKQYSEEEIQKCQKSGANKKAWEVETTSGSKSTSAYLCKTEADIQEHTTTLCGVGSPIVKYRELPNGSWTTKCGS